MNRFDYIRPSSLAEAVAEGARPGSAYLAGGTNLLDLMKMSVARPQRIVDISRLPGLDRIEWLPDGSVRIGALVRNADAAWDAGLQGRFPAVSEALLSGASPQLRNAATLGGNLLQRPRCPYFFDLASACNRRTPGAGCDALLGENRLQAVLGWSEHCIAVHPSDLCVPLVALDAIVEIEGPEGGREIALEALHRLPDATPHEETALARGELITAVRLPAAGAEVATHARYLKVRERTSYAFAVVAAFAGLDLDGETIRRARVSLGGVAAKPWRARAAEDALEGAPASRASFVRAAELALADARPSGENAFKIGLARRLVVRTLEDALARRPGELPALPASPFAPPPGAPHAA
jgi:xanthine dehydrogenase YagS FAD-binding subunit